MPNILHAYWESDRHGLIVLANDWHDGKSKPPLFFSPPIRPLEKLEAADILIFARLAGYYARQERFFFCLFADDHPELNHSSDPILVAGDFNNWNPLEEINRWRLRPTLIFGKKAYTLKVPPELASTATAFKFITRSGNWIEVPPSAPNLSQNGPFLNHQIHPSRTGKNVFWFHMPADHQAIGNEEIIWKDGDATERHLLPPTPTFLNIGTQARLGSWIENGQTFFRLFAPRARAVFLDIFRQPDESDLVTHSLQNTPEGVWEIVLAGDFRGAYYYYRVDGANIEASSAFNKDFRILDPWSLAVVSHTGPSIVVDAADFPAPKVPFTPPRWDDLFIVEAHVRDVCARHPAPLSEKERLGFSGLEKIIRQPRSYFKELGVNAIELQPIQEFDNRTPEEYHWGYMPVNYFAPASAYASDPSRASQISELQSLVAACHEAGLAVILDVVYNHVGEPNNLLFIDKYYFFEVNAHHDLLNWSGCGNDLRTDTPVGRRLVIESLIHLVRMFDVDGFRFDLADLVGKPTLVEIERALKAVKPAIILISEPWSFRGHIAPALRDTGYASWNDGFRNFITEYVHGGSNRDAAAYFLSGSPADFATWPAQTVNYAESHDDLCWLDRITENADQNGAAPTPADRRRTHLKMAWLCASLGMPMISAGQDGLRTKHGVNNTYQRGDLNAIDYERRLYYAGTANYFARWIRFRLSPAGSLLRPGEFHSGYLSFSGPDGLPAIAALYNADGSHGDKRLLFAINPTLESCRMPLPAGATEHSWVQIADHERVDPGGLSLATLPIQENSIHMPALTCGLWALKIQ